MKPKITLATTLETGRQMERKTNPLTIMYWTRAGFGLVAGLICTFLSDPTRIGFNFGILNGITIALLIYILTYYLFKNLYLAQVPKTTKILSTGIGAYFLTWIVMWTLFYSVVYRSP